MTTALELCARLAEGPTLAYAHSKRLIADAGHRTLEQTLAAEAEAQGECSRSEDHTTAVRAFLSKQQPIFTGVREAQEPHSAVNTTAPRR